MSAQTDLQNIEAELEAFAQKWANLREAEQYELAAKATAKTAHSIQQLCSSRELAGRIDELAKLPKVELDKPFAHKSGRYRNHSRFVIQYVEKRTQELEAALKKKEK